MNLAPLVSSQTMEATSVKPLAVRHSLIIAMLSLFRVTDGLLLAGRQGNLVQSNKSKAAVREQEVFSLECNSHSQ